MTNLALCVHGHFYQPPRENPFTGVIPPEPGAEPFENYNQKVHSECYKPNADLGNLELISFNVGPTLASWLQAEYPTTYERIVASDQYHQRTFGEPNGMSQAYNHTILPLATHRDKITQIVWGVADFRHRFGHMPRGMWLPEMAVDVDTLVAMQSQGLRYTILCPHQVRLRTGGWADSKSPYYVCLPDGQRFTVFLRDEELSNRLAFDQDLTQNATRFAQWCRDTIRSDDGLYILATDGETFGHHQPQRQFFLQWLLRSEAPKAGFSITTPADYLRLRPPTQEVVLVENTAWSCVHGVARWSIGCECTPGDQQWKSRLRPAFDRLAGGIDALYERECRRFTDQPWRLRSSYINVMLGRTDGLALIQDYSSFAVPKADAIRLLRLLDAQRYRQAMYTSCGWYFEDLSRIETRNNIGYAAMAIELVKLAVGIDLSTGFRSDMASARSWITDETARDIYDRVALQRRV